MKLAFLAMKTSAQKIFSTPEEKFRICSVFGKNMY